MSPNTRIYISDHPRCYLRCLMLIAAATGIITSIIVFATGRIELASGSVAVGVLFVGSIGASSWDLIDWRLEHATATPGPSDVGTTERQPLLSTSTDAIPVSESSTAESGNKDNPGTFIIILDITFVLVMLYPWFCVVVLIEFADGCPWDCNRENNVSLSVYGATVLPLVALGHMICFWRELMVAKQITWEASFEEKRLEEVRRLNKSVTHVARHEPRDSLEDHRRDGEACSCAHCASGGFDGAARLTLVEDRIVARLVQVLGGSSDFYEGIVREAGLHDGPMTVPQSSNATRGQREGH